MWNCLLLQREWYLARISTDNGHGEESSEMWKMGLLGERGRGIGAILAELDMSRLNDNELDRRIFEITRRIDTSQ